jgi:hypothetical protein
VGNRSTCEYEKVAQHVSVSACPTKLAANKRCAVVPFVADVPPQEGECSELFPLIFRGKGIAVLTRSYPMIYSPLAIRLLAETAVDVASKNDRGFRSHFGCSHSTLAMCTLAR